MSRLFFALWPDRTLQQQLAGLQLPLPSGRKVVASNLHLTLHYIGETTALDCLHSAAQKVVLPAFNFSIEIYGCFPRAGVIWTGPREWPETLDKLAAACRNLAADCDCVLKDERFRPHVTLARKVNCLPPLPDLARLLWPVHDFCLVESVSNNNCVEYRTLQRYPLQNTN
jgi:2'-5' RNA ligase